MLDKCLLIIVSTLGCCLGIPTGELDKILNINIGPEFPRILEDPLGLDNLLVQWDPQGKIFLLNNDNIASHFVASRTCQKYNMELVRIDSQEKSDLIANFLEKYAKPGEGPFWMSANRLSDDETWRWSNEEPITYSNWANKEPNNAKGDEKCVELYIEKAAWNDERCSIPSGFVCENVPKLEKQQSFQPILDSNDIEDENEISEDSNRDWQTADASETFTNSTDNTESNVADLDLTALPDSGEVQVEDLYAAGMPLPSELYSGDGSIDDKVISNENWKDKLNYDKFNYYPNPIYTPKEYS